MSPVLIIRRSTSVSLLLLAILAVCNRKDTPPTDVWPRVVEPRVSDTTPWQPCRPILRPSRVDDAQCAAPAPRATACDVMTMDERTARRAIAFRSPCLDRAIGFLQKTARQNARSMNDLAAGYYVRAQRDDRASDLLRALDAAEQAVAISPVPPGAHFNRALILQSLGLNEDALAEWDIAARSEKDGWAREAHARHDALARVTAQSGDRRWAMAEDRIERALANNDEAAVAAAVAPFPLTAEKYFENQLLPEWPHKRSLAALRVFANGLSRALGERFAADTVNALEKASPRQLVALKAGQDSLSNSRAQDRKLRPKAAADIYPEATRLLAQGGTPLALSAEIVRATAAGDLNALRETSRKAAMAGYPRLAARAEANGGYVLFARDRYVEALAEYDKVLSIYNGLHDFEGIANTQARRIGMLRVLGKYDQAFHDVLPVLRNASSIVDLNTHHLLIGETAAIATKLDCPHSALAYMNAEVRHFQQEERALPDPESAQTLESHVAIARRNRAAVELQLDDLRDAQADIDEASRLAGKNTDATARRLLEARLDEIKGQSLLRSDPSGAAAMFQRAAGLSGDDYSSFMIALLVERAGALRRSGRRDDAEATLRVAIDRLHREEATTLQQRSAGHEPPVWKEYFDRFRDANDLLIRQLLDDGRMEEAFSYNEEAHAFEPLDLVLRRGDTPQAFRDLAAADARTLQKRLQTFLPAGTFLIEYRVLDDVTFVWIVSRESAHILPLEVKRSDVERWTGALQDAAALGNRDRFAEGLYAPYDKLIAPAMALIGDRAARIVVVPDEFMHGLPFAALRDPISHQYLIKRAPLSISGSGLLYVFSLLRDAAIPTARTTALLIGDPAFESRVAPGVEPLPSARVEVRAIAPMYGGNAEVLVGREATPSRFLRDAPKHQIIHIAAHALTTGDAPRQSFLLLASEGRNSGVLDAETLLTGLRLNDTRLVVLGACRSGESASVGPQGVGPLVRPFLAAGVPGVIGTLWDINDATAKEVLVSFHRHYRLGNDAAVALQAAQIEQLKSKNPLLNSELTWAAYEAIGYASSPFAAAGDIKKEKPPP
jgi:CHAT domain-containing protein